MRSSPEVSPLATGLDTGELRPQGRGSCAEKCISRDGLIDPCDTETISRATRSLFRAKA